MRIKGALHLMAFLFAASDVQARDSACVQALMRTPVCMTRGEAAQTCDGYGHTEQGVQMVIQCVNNAITMFSGGNATGMRLTPTHRDLIKRVCLLPTVNSTDQNSMQRLCE